MSKNCTTCKHNTKGYHDEPCASCHWPTEGAPTKYEADKPEHNVNRQIKQSVLLRHIEDLTEENKKLTNIVKDQNARLLSKQENYDMLHELADNNLELWRKTEERNKQLKKNYEVLVSVLKANDFVICYGWKKHCWRGDLCEGEDVIVTEPPRFKKSWIKKIFKRA